MFNAINQSFFMGFFFLLAGFYTPGSFDRKGPKKFLDERFVRLGVPLLVYFLIISPLTNAYVHPQDGVSIWSGFLEMYRNGELEPGTLWFVETLLIFALLYFAWRKMRTTKPNPIRKLPPFPRLLLATLAIGVISFGIRLFYPVGTSILWLQIGYFPAYVFLFAAGCWVSESKLLDKISFREARPWMLLSFVTAITLPIVLTTRSDQGPFTGGLNLNSLYYAQWDPFLAWG